MQRHVFGPDVTNGRADWRRYEHSVENLTGGVVGIEEVVRSRPLVPFDPEVIGFLSAFSESLFAHEDARHHPDVAALAFWCRRRSIEAMRRAYPTLDKRVGRGLAFHVAPSNVPLNFAYSLFSGLLAGNSNIVKVPSRPFVQTRIVSDVLREVLNRENHQVMRNRICLLRYDRELRELTDWLSSVCDVRLIWGGDSSIDSIRESPLRPRAVDIAFADRYSVCVISADAYNEVEDAGRIAQAFYNDTYLLDQAACTAPHLVFWIGNEVACRNARKRFWTALQALLEDSYLIDGATISNKLTVSMLFAAQQPGVAIELGPTSHISRVVVSSLTDGLPAAKASCGLFYEYVSNDLTELFPIVTERYQTLSFFGLDPEEVRRMVLRAGLRGIDRIVPMGRTLDFSLEWDGYDLISVLSRVVSLGEI